jgi:hypothetical protein
VGLVVGLAVAGFSFLLPRYFSESKEISYSVEGPIAYMDSAVGASISVSVNGVPTRGIYAYPARIWNSGTEPVTQLPVHFIFTPRGDALTILSARHNTTPPHEFGVIAQTESTSVSRRYVYGLRNSK